MSIELEVSKHSNVDDAWVIYKDKVLDITKFIDIHPGGNEMLVPYLGKDITIAFKQADHSLAAEQMIDTFVINRNKPSDGLINPYKGLVYQVWTKLNLESYKKFVNSPSVVIGHIRVFDSPFLEIFSMTPWQVIPVIWLPVVIYLFCLSYPVIGAWAFLAFLAGMFFWTLFEYSLHRFGFHSENDLPDNRYFITFHFLIHGIHHAYPTDSLRLVFPPALAVIMALVVKQGIYNNILPVSVSDAFFAGKVLGYVWYDLFHYFSHHAELEKGYFGFMKSYHLAHHYKSPDFGFGVSNHFWDIVFGTEIKLSKTYKSIFKSRE